MTYLENYKRWLEAGNLDPSLSRELLTIANDPVEIEDRFYKNLEFGTGGLRGLLGVGTNRINKHTVAKATVGIAKHILSLGDSAISKGVVIAYDSRHLSAEFAETAASVFTSYGIRVYLFESLRPTPMLSFAVRYLQAQAGIVVTASHNPPEYNGYKVYWADGAQIETKLAKTLYDSISSIENEFEILDYGIEYGYNEGLLVDIGSEIDEAYYREVLDLVPDHSPKGVKIVYSPIHGAGLIPVTTTLDRAGFRNLHVVSEQSEPDPNFSTVKSPNPEDREAFELALTLAKEVQADLVLATDPDVDRVGVYVLDKSYSQEHAQENAMHEGEYVPLTGNQIGALILDYVLATRFQRGELPSNGVVLKTIVTSEIGTAIARRYGIETVDVLTGFKFIGEKIEQYNQSGEKTFLFGYEESYGYLAGSFCRDKDAVGSCLLLAEIAECYHQQGRTLVDALEGLYARYGYFREDLYSLTLKGIEGTHRINELIARFRDRTPSEFASAQILDYQRGINDLPPSNVLKFVFPDRSWFAIRPSGTEPKLKVYFGVVGNSSEDADQQLEKLKSSVLNYLQ